MYAAYTTQSSPRTVVQQDASRQLPVSEDDADTEAPPVSPFDLKETVASERHEETLPEGPLAVEVASLSASMAADAFGQQLNRLMAQGTLPDEQTLSELVLTIRADPDLLAQLAEQFRQATDPDQQRWLADLLGEVGGASVTALASELIFSGHAPSRALGFELLQDVQPGNEQARAMVSDMLNEQLEPADLVGALTALARPGQVSTDARERLAEQVAWLTVHDNVQVRSISLDLLSRWSTDGQYTQMLLSGLSDPEPQVRSAAVYALVDHEDPSIEVITQLFAVFDRPEENLRVRRGAIQALNSMPLSVSERDRVLELERGLNRVPAR